MLIDWQGLSFFTTAATVGVATLVNVWIAVRNSNSALRAENERLATEQRRHEVEVERSNKEAENARVLGTIEKHVNGMNTIIAEGAFAQGKAVGIKDERANPMVPADTATAKL